MTFVEIVKDYIKQNSVKFYFFIGLCSVVYITKVLLTSILYSKFFEKDPDFSKIIKRVAFIWVVLCLLYIIKSRIEASIMPDFLSYIRRRLFEKYIKSNETHLNEKDVSSDLNRILEVTRNIRDVFSWMSVTFIPIVVLMIVITLYFLVKY